MSREKSKQYLSMILIDQTVGTDGQQCSSHAECAFMDCRGLCNQTTSKCEPKVQNDNFQVICEEVFLGKHK